MMYEEPKLSDQQWELLVELLEREHNELPVEIHHTRNSAVREELHRRQEIVKELLERLRSQVAV
jgi:hypothetical protein